MYLNVYDRTLVLAKPQTTIYKRSKQKSIWLPKGTLLFHSKVCFGRFFQPYPFEVTLRSHRFEPWWYLVWGNHTARYPISWRASQDKNNLSGKCIDSIFLWKYVILNSPNNFGYSRVTVTHSRYWITICIIRKYHNENKYEKQKKWALEKGKKSLQCSICSAAIMIL